MVIHPSVSSFNDSNVKSEQLISKWLNRMLTFNEKLTMPINQTNSRWTRFIGLGKKWDCL